MFQTRRCILWVATVVVIAAAVIVQGVSAVDSQTIVLRQQEIADASEAFSKGSRKINSEDMGKVEACWKKDGSIEVQKECIRAIQLRVDYQYLAESFCVGSGRNSIGSLEKFKKRCDDIERKWLAECTGKAAFATLEVNGHLESYAGESSTTTTPIEVVLGKGACAVDGTYLVENLVNAGYHVVILAINLRYKTDLLNGEDDTFYKQRFRLLQRLCNRNRHPLLKIHYITSAQMESEILNDGINELQSLYAYSYKEEKDSRKKFDAVSKDTTIEPEESRLLNTIRDASLAEANAIIADLQDRATSKGYSKTLIIICFVGAGFEHPDEIKRKTFIRFDLAEKLAGWLSTRQRLGSKLAHMELPFNTTTERGDFHLNKSGTLEKTPCVSIKPDIIILGILPREALMAINVDNTRKGKPAFYQLKNAQAIYLTVLTHPMYPGIKMSTCMKAALQDRNPKQQPKFDKFFEALRKKEEEAISEFPTIHPKFLKLELPATVINSEDYMSPFAIANNKTDNTFSGYLALLRGTYKNDI